LVCWRLTTKLFYIDMNSYIHIPPIPRQRPNRRPVGNKKEPPILSVLIATLEERKQLVTNMQRILTYQSNGQVEILTAMDNRENTIGKKRQELLQQCRGEYVCFLDDDDMISPYYVQSIIGAILPTRPDCVGIKGIIVMKNHPPAQFIHSIAHDKWYKKDGVYYRCPNHLNPIKRDIALQVGFNDKNVGEDWDYSRALIGKLKSEHMIDEPIYYYYPSRGI
jgi:glycosyltransferase involved in cell wall biosynthesis